MKSRIIFIPLVASVLLSIGCGGSGTASDPALRRAMEAVEAEQLETHMGVLADDGMQGRGTGSVGHFTAARYVADRLAEYGVQPRGEHESFFQQVPLIAARVDPDRVESALTRDGKRQRFEWGEDYLSTGDCMRLGAEVEAAVTFLGFGIRAPEQEYDDYKGVDVTGKLVAIFEGAPDEFPADVAAFHTRRNHKRHMAAAAGAVGILWLGRPEGLRERNWQREVELARMESMCRVAEDGTPLGVESELLVEARLGESLEQLLLESLDERRLPMELPGRFSLRTASIHRRLESPNVVGWLPGAEGAGADEYVVLTAHLDHLGTREDGGGDRIYNGAYDNASGVALLLELARVWGEREVPARRSVLFLVTTGEEHGALGARHFLAHGTVPRKAMIANINLERILMLGTPLDLVAHAADHTTLGEETRMAAEMEGLHLTEDSNADRGLHGGGDLQAFQEAGIPGLSVVAGMEGVGSWMRQTYHTPADDMGQVISYEVGARIARVNLAIAWRVADADRRPAWNDGDFLGNRFSDP